MLKATNNVNRNPNSAALIVFKPRQVVLAEQRTKAITMSKKQTKPRALNPEQKTSLLHFVIKYLENRGFSKTLKRFLSEAQIENEDWKAVAHDLEDVYWIYLDSRNHDETTVSTTKKEEIQTELTTKDNGKSDCAASEDLTKKKKKKRVESEKVVAADQSKVIDNKNADVTKNSEELMEVDIISEPAKIKGKKKSKKGSDNSDENKPIQSLETSEQVENTLIHDNGKLNDNTKNKKKKKSRPNNDDQEQRDLVKVVVEEQSENLASAADGTKKEEKSSKKRKREISEEHENQPDDNEASEKSKVKKSKGSEKSKKEKAAVMDGCEKIEKDRKLVNNIESTKMSTKALDDDENGELGKTVEKQLDHANGNLEKSGEKSGYKNSTKKQRSTEPKTVNAFQRVKVDAVEFADEKLQDNSYWAKDGAEIGYGAKAQEVLGQVRGRDFRHEKTKKKRGSYRGGLIDLQSHSVKFNYSDEE